MREVTARNMVNFGHCTSLTKLSLNRSKIADKLAEAVARPAH